MNFSKWNYNLEHPSFSVSMKFCFIEAKTVVLNIILIRKNLMKFIPDQDDVKV